MMSFSKNPVIFKKTRPFIRNPGFQKPPSFYQKPGLFQKTPSIFKKPRPFSKTPVFYQKPGFSKNTGFFIRTKHVYMLIVDV